MSGVERDLPLFPLGAVVLFPDMSLNLRVFENRYKQLVSDVLQGDSSFGIALIREGREVGMPAVPHEVGTIARITEVAPLDDGNLYISTVGSQRFRILEVVEPRPYLLARVEVLDEGPAEAPEELVAEARQAMTDYVQAVTAMQGGWVRDVPVRHDAVPLSYLIAATVRAEPLVKQRLLEVPTVAERLTMEAALLQQSAQRLRSRLPDRGPGSRFSKN